MTPQQRILLFSIAGAGLLGSCSSVCGCPPTITTEVLYGRVESATGGGIPSAVINYRLTLDTLCVFGEVDMRREILADAQGRFRETVYSGVAGVQCLELAAYDPASKTDTVSILIFADFTNPDSTGVVLRLP